MKSKGPLVECGYKYVPYSPIGPDGSRDTTKELWAVEITDGKFEGMKYEYPHWKIEEVVDPITFEKKHKLNFKYNILPTSSREEPTDADTKLEMMSMMGNILLNILIEVARIEWPKKELNE